MDRYQFEQILEQISALAYSPEWASKASASMASAPSAGISFEYPSDDSWPQRRAYILSVGAKLSCSGDVKASPDRASIVLPKLGLLSEWLLSAYHAGGPLPLANSSVYSELAADAVLHPLSDIAAESRLTDIVIRETAVTCLVEFLILLDARVAQNGSSNDLPTELQSLLHHLVHNTPVLAEFGIRAAPKAIKAPAILTEVLEHLIVAEVKERGGLRRATTALDIDGSDIDATSLVMAAVEKGSLLTLLVLTTKRFNAKLAVSVVLSHSLLLVISNLLSAFRLVVVLKRSLNWINCRNGLMLICKTAVFLEPMSTSSWQYGPR